MLTQRKPKLLDAIVPLTLALALAGCSSTQGVSAWMDSSAPSYALTLSLQPGDTTEALTNQYGGRVAVWRPEGGFAIISTSRAPQVNDPRVKAVDNNRKGIESPELKLAIKWPVAPSSTAIGAGWGAWANGWGAWANGWGAWANGTGTQALPSSNRQKLLQMTFPQGQALARNRGQGIKVAVIDTGIDINHPAFQGRLAPAGDWKDFVDGDANPQEIGSAGVDAAFGHGTAAAGIVAQFAPKASILPIRVLGPDGSGDVDNVVAAMDWAIQKGAKVINLSLGANVEVAALNAMVDYASSLGVYVVAAAGNNGDTSILYPAALAKRGPNAKYVISVGSISAANELSVFTCRGAALEVVAPGEAVFSTEPNNQIGYRSGTSFAAPMVSGALALALSDTSPANTGNLEANLLQSGLTGPHGYRALSLQALMASQPNFQPRQALFVAGSTSLDGGDAALVTRMQNLGYSVALAAAASANASSATGKDLVVISASASETDLQANFKDVGVPVVTWQAATFDEMGMTSNAAGESGTQADQASIKLVNASHPLAAGLQADPAVYATNGTLTWGKPGAGASIITGLVTDSSKATLFAYEPGSAMVGLNAPARRVGFFLGSAQGSSLTGTGATLFDSAITWAASGF